MTPLDGEFSLTTWVVSVGAVIVCAATAWREGHWRRRPDLDLGFVDHGGMWGDLILLPIANAAIVPHLAAGPWLAVPFAMAMATSIWLHVRWHGGHTGGVRDHMWPSRPHGVWHRDLSAAGWLHVIYVVGEFGLILAFAMTVVPASTVWLVTAVLTLHVPLGLLHPGWRATGAVPRRALPLLAGALMLLWGVAAIKITTGSL